MAAQPYPEGPFDRSTSKMFAYYPQSQFQPCPDCGAPVANDEDEVHRCERRRFVEYQMLLLRPEIVAFEDQLTEWLDTPVGRFSTYYATRERLRFASLTSS
jgi:NAD-dependent SIR2 family protein deacetylase